MPINPSEYGKPMFRNIFSAIPMFDEYNMPIFQFVNECYEIQSAVSSQEEANVVILFRSKLRGRTCKALHNRKFTSIK